MTSKKKTPAMDQRIFKIGLPVETVSLYLLCCSLADVETDLSTSNMLKTWNGTEKTLTRALAELEKRNILCRIASDGAGIPIYQLMDSKNWQASQA